MKDLEENNKSKNQFLNDLYDDFFYLISSNPEEFDSQKKNSTNSEIQK